MSPYNSAPLRTGSRKVNPVNNPGSKLEHGDMIKLFLLQ